MKRITKIRRISGPGGSNEMPRVGPGSFAKSVKTSGEGYPSAPAGGKKGK